MNLESNESNDAESTKSPRRLRRAHLSRTDGSTPGKPAPFAWRQVIPTKRRERAIEGMLVGCAIGDAISINRHGIHPRVALKMFGRCPLEYRFQPGIGVSSEWTHSLIMTVQSMLISRTDKTRFTNQLRKRITWYQRARPFHTLGARLFRQRGSQGQTHDDSLSVGIADDPLLRGIVLSVMLQGCTDSTSRWFQQCVEVSHVDSRAVHATVLIGHAVQIAQVVEPESIDAIHVLDLLLNSTDEPTLVANLEKLKLYVQDRRSVAYVARSFGWDSGVPNNLFAISTMALYAWLRHSSNFRKCVERAAMLGGSCGNVASIAGAIAAINLGRQSIPDNWTQRLSWFPYNPLWREELIERVKDWPHGVEDIQRATGVPSYLGGQLLRNVSIAGFALLHSLIRIPVRWTLCTFRKRRNRL